MRVPRPGVPVPKPGRPGPGKPGKKPSRSLIDDFEEYKKKNKKNLSNIKSVPKTIGYAITATQNRLKGGKKGPGKVGRLAR